MNKAQPQHPPQFLVLDMDEMSLSCPQFETEEEAEQVIALAPLFSRVYSIETRDIGVPRGTGSVERMLAIERPYLQKFLAYIKRRFTAIIIWSAGVEDYVYENIAHVTRWAGAPVLSLHREHCELRSDGLYSKPLRKLIGMFKDLTLANTFIVDDRSTAFEGINDENGITIPAFEPTCESLTTEVMSSRVVDHALLQLMRFFDRPEVRSATDIRVSGIQALKSTIFTRDALVDRVLSRIVSCPADGDCFFSAMATALTCDPVLEAASAEAIGMLRATNKTFAYLLAQLKPQRIVSARHLRMMVATHFFENRKFAQGYLDAHKVLEDIDPNHPEVAWLQHTKNNNGTYDMDRFLQMSLSAKHYWGDEAAMEILSDRLNIDIEIHQPVKPRGFISSKMFAQTNPVGRVHLLLHNNHFETLC